MDKLKMHSIDGVAQNVERIAELFPNCVTETGDDQGNLRLAVDYDKLKVELGEVVEGNEERYQFTWPGKREAIRLANSPIAAALRPVREDSVDFDTTQNLYIEGDNLDVLKLLRETYLGKVKMIYIDPPYNTGNDFVYEDDFSQTAADYLANSDQYDDQGNRLVANTESNGRFHTNWLNMIYPRLKAARDLLTKDGIIFISIDDNELGNLIKICNEIFGERNYINHFAWISNLTGRQIAGQGAAKTWESILVYVKDINYAKSLFVDISFAKQNLPDVYKGFEKDIREDSHGKFAIGDTLYNHNRKFNEETRRNLVFSIFYNPKTEEIKTGEIGERMDGFVEIPPHQNGDGVHKYHAWRWSRKKIQEESYDLIVLPKSKGFEIYTKIRDFNTTLLKDIISNVSNGDSEVQSLFSGRKFFDYPKSVTLLQLLMGSYLEKEHIVLDFFSGSSTTAHAVMKLNASDGGNRKFIMVQLPELTYTSKTEVFFDSENKKQKRYIIDPKTRYPVVVKDSEARKAGYYYITEIGKERIRRAGKKIKEENPEAKDLDIGFRVLRIDSSNMEDVYYTPDKFEPGTLQGLLDNVKSDRTAEDLLFQVMLEFDVPLSAKIEQEQIAGKHVFNVADGHLIATFDKDVNESTVTEIARRKPNYFVMRDASAANDNVLDNFEQIFKHYSPETKCRVL